MDNVETIISSERLGKWYESFQDILTKIGLKFGYCHEEILDFINQFFLDLLEKEINVDNIKNPRAYLSVAFKRKLINHYRASGRNSIKIGESEFQNIAESSILDSMEQTESNAELNYALRKAYDNLPPRCQKVIELKFYKGLSTGEIALETGLSKRSVYNNLFEGIRLLRSELQKHSSGVHALALISCLTIILSAVI